MSSAVLLGFALAAGIGLLIGIDRERRKGQSASFAPGGLRTFTVAALIGAASAHIGGSALLTVAVAAVALLAGLSYWRSKNEDPGLTTELALVLTTMLGGLAISEPTLAGGLGVTLAIILAARTPLHRFAKTILTDQEIRDVLMFASAALVVHPLLPAESYGPYSALNPKSIWSAVVLILGVNVLGHVMTRALGKSVGLPISGLASGFISSTATIGAMALRARNTPALLIPAVGGAVLSTVATIIYMAIILAVTNMDTLRVLTPALAAGGIVALAYGAFFTVRSGSTAVEGDHTLHQTIGVRAILILVALLCALSMGLAALQAWLGSAGLVTAAALGGFLDAHAAAVSVANMVASGALAPRDAVLPILASLSTNTVSKLVFTVGAGSWPFIVRVLPGTLLVLAALWAAGAAAGMGEP